MLDSANTVRKGEEIDSNAVTEYLMSQGIALQGQPEVTQFSGGASNWTYRLKYANRDLILRRPPKGTKAKSAHDMVREYKVQKALQSQYPLVPNMVALCTDDRVIGCDFYVMDRIEGIIPALESSHALAYAAKLAPTLPKDKVLLVNLSGRGDKDMHTVAERSGIQF